jgi:hypothetical protein
MCDVFSGTNQGTFISTGKAKNLIVRSDIDWMVVRNITIAAANQTTAVGVEYFWQRGFPAGAMWEYKKSNAAAAANLSVYATTGGFTLYNNTVDTPGPLIAISAISNAARPVVSTANTAGLSNGDVIRLINVTGAQQMGGEDFTINSLIANTSFELANMQAIVAGTTGFYRRIPNDPYFYPPTREIARITPGPSANTPLAAGLTVVTLTVTHNYTIGQVVRFIIPAVTATTYGMVELNEVQATIVGINQADSTAPYSVNSVAAQYNTITVDVDSTAFTAFAWPLTGDPAHTTAQVVPVGENTAVALAGGYIGLVTSTGASTASYAATFTDSVNVLGDSERNIGEIGITLAAGANSPAGVAGDVIYWIAGKSRVGGI